MTSLISPLLWSFLPSQLTSILLPFASSILPSIFPAAPKHTLQGQKNHRNLYTALITLYILYNLFDSTTPLSENYYAILGVKRSIDEDGLKRAFRGLSRIYHPDRAGGSGGDIFIAIRQAYEVLNDSTKRYAYDRFGPDITGWKAKSVKEYMYVGLTQSIGFYLVSGAIMLLLNEHYYMLQEPLLTPVTGRATHGAYWRHTLFILLLSLELSLILSPTPTPGTLPFFPRLSAYLPSRLTMTPQFIWIRRLHRVWTSLSIAISQLAGVWASPKLNEEEYLGRIAALVGNLQAEAVGQFHREVVPILSRSGDPLSAQAALMSSVEHIMLDSTVSSHPAIRGAWQEALARPHTHHAHNAHNAHSGRQVYPDLMTLQLAIQTPLPPSPPSSPRIGYRALDDQ